MTFSTDFRDSPARTGRQIRDAVVGTRRDARIGFRADINQVDIATAEALDDSAAELLGLAQDFGHQLHGINPELLAAAWTLRPQSPTSIRARPRGACATDRRVGSPMMHQSAVPVGEGLGQRGAFPHLLGDRHDQQHTSGEPAAAPPQFSAARPGGDGSLHVNRSAAVEAAVDDVRTQRIVPPCVRGVDGNRIDAAVHDQRLSARLPTRPMRFPCVSMTTSSNSRRRISSAGRRMPCFSRPGVASIRDQLLQERDSVHQRSLPCLSGHENSPYGVIGPAMPPEADLASSLAQPTGPPPRPPALTRVRGVLDLLRDHIGVSDGIRTHDIQDHNLALEPTELRPPWPLGLIAGAADESYRGRDQCSGPVWPS